MGRPLENIGGRAGLV